MRTDGLVAVARRRAHTVNCGRGLRGACARTLAVGMLAALALVSAAQTPPGEAPEDERDRKNDAAAASASASASEGAGGSPGAAPPAPPTPRPRPSFVPSEKVSADSAVAFPVDI